MSSSEKKQSLSNRGPLVYISFLLCLKFYNLFVVTFTQYFINILYLQ